MYTKVSKKKKQLPHLSVGKISTERVTAFLCKYIFKGDIDIKFSPDGGNDPPTHTCKETDVHK